jgi:hypothetical protein
MPKPTHKPRHAPTFPMLFGLAYDPVSDLAFGKLELRDYGDDATYGKEYFM